jgi:hypothetical protein
MRHTIMLLALVTVLTGCGGGTASNSTSQPTDPTPPATPWAISGPWQFALTSNTNPGTYRVLNVNLSQTGTKIYTVTQSATMVQIVDSVVEFMDDCTDTNGSGDSLSGTLGTPSTQNQSQLSDFTFTFAEAGLDFSEQIAVTGQISQPNGFILSGTYTMTGGCAQADSGTVIGTALSASSTSGASGDLFGFYAGSGVSGVGEYSLSAGGMSTVPELTVYQNQYPSFSLTYTLIGGQFFTTQTNASVLSEINGLFLAEDTLEWQTIFGPTLYPFPGHSAYYLQEETSPVSNGVYVCTAAAPAGTPNCS